MNEQTREEFEALLELGWTFSGSDRSIYCKHGWTGRCKGKGDVKGETLELCVRLAYANR